MNYVLITPNKIRLILTEEENHTIQQAIINNDKAVFVKNSTISLNITPEIYPFEVWYPQENQRLALTHHRLCKKCLCIMAIEDKCPCWEEQGKGEVQNAFNMELPTPLKEKVKELADKKSFPKLTNWDKSEVLSNEQKKQIPFAEPEENDFYIDENGIKQYS